MATKSVREGAVARKRSAADRSASAKKAAETKGATGRREAARKAARTRARQKKKAARDSRPRPRRTSANKLLALQGDREAFGADFVVCAVSPPVTRYNATASRMECTPSLARMC